MPESDWKAVPAPERATIDNAARSDVAKLEAELATTDRAIAEARATHALVKRPAAHAPAPVVAPGDDWATAMRAHDQDLLTARVQIDEATTAWLAARVAWHEHRREVIVAQLAVARCQHEVVRAKAIDHHLLGTETYDAAVYRAQLASVQERWYAADQKTETVRIALEHASTALAASKDHYARLVRRGPNAPTGAAADEPQLATWNPIVDRDRGHRLHFKRVVADQTQYLTAPALGHRALHR